MKKDGKRRSVKRSLGDVKPPRRTCERRRTSNAEIINVEGINEEERHQLLGDPSVQSFFSFFLYFSPEKRKHHARKVASDDGKQVVWMISSSSSPLSSSSASIVEGHERPAHLGRGALTTSRIALFPPCRMQRETRDGKKKKKRKARRLCVRKHCIFISKVIDSGSENYFQ